MSDSTQQYANGLRYIARRMPDADSVTAHVFIGAGGRYEDLQHEDGVSHFLEHLLFKGSQKYPTPQSMSETIEGLGGYHNAYTGHELTTFFVKLPKDHLATGLNILADLTRRPLFDPTEIDRERGVILEEMNVYRDDPAQHVFDYVGQMLWPQSNLRSDILGNSDIIRSLPPEVIRGYHAATYTPDNVVVSLAGNIDLEQAEALVEAEFGDWTGNHTRLPVAGHGSLATTRSHVFRRETSQAHLVLAGRAVPYRHPDETPLRVLAAALGGASSSRLYNVVREQRGLAYSIYMRAVGYTDTGEWEIYAGVGHQNLREAVSAIAGELSLMRQHGVTEDELQRVKQQLHGRIIMSQETNGAVADRIGSELLLTGEARPLTAILAQIDSVSREDVLRVAQRYLDPSAIRLSLIASIDEAEQRELESIL